MMSRRDFDLLFRRKLREAADLAEAKLGRSIPRNFGILRGSSGPDGRRVSIEQAVSELFLSETEFYRVIDLAVVEVSATTTWVWARESGHHPAAFEVSWNQQPGSGPFKHLISDTIRTSTEPAWGCRILVGRLTMHRAVAAILCALLSAAPLSASQEGVLVLGSFKVESPGIGESGPVVVSGRQNASGFERLEVSAFGKVFTLTKTQLKELRGGLTNGLQFSYEGGYSDLGGRTIYLRFSKGFTSGVAEAKLVTITESGSITVTAENKR